MQFKKLPITAALCDLTPQQAEFVRCFVELGAEEDAVAEAAVRAGYGGGVRSKAEQYARRELLRNPRVQSAIKAEINNEFVVGAALGVKTLMHLCRTAPPSVRLAAAQELLNRGVGPIVSRAALMHMKTEKSVEDFLDILDAEGAPSSQAGAIEAEYTEIAEPGSSEEVEE